MVHLLVTNDFPPKIGGIQSYLYEIYKRAPRDSAIVVTTQYQGAREFDLACPVAVIRMGPRLLPTPGLVRRLNRFIGEFSPVGVMIDPLFPLGSVARWLDAPYGIITHGAEVTVPAAIPGVRADVARTLWGARGVIAAGSYPERQSLAIAPGAEVFVVPPGVDSSRFHPCSEAERWTLRTRLMRDPSARSIVFVSRLVPRKGADTLIRAVAGWQGVEVHVVGDGRDRGRLESLAVALDSPVFFHGRVSSQALVSWYQLADVCAFPVRSRWGGLEQEGFGMVVTEAQASGVPVVATAAGGVPDAVVPSNPALLPEGATPAMVRALLARVLMGPAERDLLREETLSRFSWDGLARRYHARIASWFAAKDQETNNVV